MTIQLIRKEQVRALYACGKTHLQDQINKGLIPKPIQIGQRAVAFYESEIQASLAAMVAGYSDDQLKAFVKELVERRKDLISKYVKESAND